jgi:hypothetical protein
VSAFVLYQTTLTCWEMINAQKTIVYDQIYAQSRVKGQSSRYFARIQARKYGRQLSDAFHAEPECSGLSFSVRANHGLRGRPGRWKLMVDMLTSETPDQVISTQPWSLVQPNRDGAGSPDIQIAADKGEPAMIVKEACEVVRGAGG